MIKIQGSSQLISYVDEDHYWKYATDLSGNDNKALVEVISVETGECVLTISAVIAVDRDELTLVVE